jgi:hypothetical protein
MTMTMLEDNERMEYQALMGRGRDAEWTSQLCWVVSGIAATALLAWGIAARSSTLMLPVVFAVAYGFYAMLRARQQVRLIAGYIEEFFEAQGTGARWFTWLGHLRLVPGLTPSSDWFATCLANFLVLLAVVFAWMFVPPPTRNSVPSNLTGLMPGLVTGCAVAFMFHSISETARLHRANFAAFWRQVNSGPMKDHDRKLNVVPTPGIR